jgi:hypothetical protein
LPRADAWKAFWDAGLSRLDALEPERESASSTLIYYFSSFFLFFKFCNSALKSISLRLSESMVTIEFVYPKLIEPLIAESPLDLLERAD